MYCVCCIFNQEVVLLVIIKNFLNMFNKIWLLVRFLISLITYLCIKTSENSTCMQRSHALNGNISWSQWQKNAFITYLLINFKSYLKRIFSGFLDFYHSRFYCISNWFLCIWYLVIGYLICLVMKVIVIPVMCI